MGSYQASEAGLVWPCDQAQHPVEDCHSRLMPWWPEEELGYKNKGVEWLSCAGPAHYHLGKADLSTAAFIHMLPPTT